MKVIELLNLISRDRELPNKIKYNGYIFEYDINHKRYEAYFDEQIWVLQDFISIDDDLNNEVEIIEENKTKSLTKKDIETLGYACGEIQKCFTNGWTKSLENKPLEEHKIPEKLIHCYTDKLTKEFVIKCFDDVSDKINEILDYLEEKE